MFDVQSSEKIKFVFCDLFDFLIKNQAAQDP